MVIHNVRQNSEEWEALRRGRVTASAMDRVVCPEMGNRYLCGSCGKEFERRRKYCDEKVCGGDVIAQKVVVASDAQNRYLWQLVYEALTGLSIPHLPTAAMERGHEMEPKAIAAYEFVTGNDTEVVGFGTTDDGYVGASPDRLSGTDRIVEAKCPQPWVHLQYLATPGKLTQDYFCQAQAQLLVFTGRKVVDLFAYSEFPNGTPLPLVLEHVGRDEEFQSGMNDVLVPFITRVHETIAKLRAAYGDFSRLPKPAAEPEFGLDIAPEDVAAIYAASQERSGLLAE